MICFDSFVNVLLDVCQWMNGGGGLPKKKKKDFAYDFQLIIGSGLIKGLIS